MFSHAVKPGTFIFVRIATNAGALSTSPGHFVHTASGTKAASAVVRGDYLKSANGSFAKVQSIELVLEEGLYNPQTIDGDIVVDGFIVSTYTRAVPVSAAASMLAPVRAAYSLFHVDITAGTMGYENSWRKILCSAWRGGQAALNSVITSL